MIQEKSAGADLNEKATDMIVRSADPLNCEPPIHRLGRGVLVSNEYFYVRNHFPPPDLDSRLWRLRVRGLVKNPLSLQLADLRDFAAQTMVVTLECAGNGRSRLTPPVEGEQWGLGAVSTAEWTGVRLADVLDRACPKSTSREAVFRAADVGSGRPDRFERSLTLDEIERAPVLLAYAMNGRPLPVQHGFPLRLIVPGWYAVASVKWLTEIELIDRPFAGYFQTHKYVYEWQGNGALDRELVRRQQVRSLITQPADGEAVQAESVAVCGFAWSGVAPVARVEVSIDGGRWVEARMLGRADRWSWRRWELRARAVRRGPVIIRSRATDREGRVQPEQGLCNLFGYGNNAIQQVTVTAV